MARFGAASTLVRSTCVGRVRGRPAPGAPRRARRTARIINRPIASGSRGQSCRSARGRPGEPTAAVGVTSAAVCGRSRPSHLGRAETRKTNRRQWKMSGARLLARRALMIAHLAGRRPARAPIVSNCARRAPRALQAGAAHFRPPAGGAQQSGGRRPPSLAGSGAGARARIGPDFGPERRQTRRRPLCIGIQLARPFGAGPGRASRAGSAKAKRLAR